MSRTISFHTWCMENRKLIESTIEFGSDFMHDMQHDRDMPRACRYRPLHEYVASLRLSDAPFQTFVQMYELYSSEALKANGSISDGPCNNKVYDDPEDCDLEPHLMYTCRQPARHGEKCNECKRG